MFCYGNLISTGAELEKSQQTAVAWQIIECAHVFVRLSLMNCGVYAALQLYDSLAVGNPPVQQTPNRRKCDFSGCTKTGA